ncbi:MAG: response regulator [Gomphosphaeria aponina SAG 52.96 = DSM 107014]|uniref:Response regulator n=1 Tax=Gomphosphaeria aponina SAG 52.96 = DSM 107014 TaxID=1521640 RepID=A0A941GTI5_9CHRO|nr:response regulator [Gomphosphaeria aponina SAG 52.96 = DSM 107014]
MTRKTILVIDDDDGLREIIKLSLSTLAGWEVITAGSGKEGLSKAATEQPDAILLDMVLPEMDGLTIWRELAAKEATKHIPTIFLTASADVKEVKQLLSEGEIKAIAKPLTPDQLVSQIRKILHWKE